MSALDEVFRRAGLAESRLEPEPAPPPPLEPFPWDVPGEVCGFCPECERLSYAPCGAVHECRVCEWKRGPMTTPTPTRTETKP